MFTTGRVFTLIFAIAFGANWVEAGVILSSDMYPVVSSDAITPVVPDVEDPIIVASDHSGIAGLPQAEYQTRVFSDCATSSGHFLAPLLLVGQLPTAAEILRPNPLLDHLLKPA